MKKLLTLILAAALVVCVCGCSGDQGLKKVRLTEVTHSVFYAPMYAAIQLGFFEEAGLEIELTNAGGADKGMTAVLSGQADIGFMGPEAAVYAINEGASDTPAVFAQLTQCDGAFLVSRVEEPDFQWENLIGKTVIGGRKGGVPEMTLEYVLRQKGIDPKNDLYIDTGVQFALMGGAFIGGEGDYVALFEPTATQVVNEGHGYIVASIGAESGSVPYTCYMALDSYIKENADTVDAFVRTLYRAQQWVMESSDEDVAKAIAEAFPDTDAATLTQVVARYRSINAWAQTPVMAPESYERLLDIMQQAGELSARPAFDAVIDNSIAEKIVNE